MKKLVSLVTIGAIPNLANAQGVKFLYINMETVRMCAAIFVVGLFMLFILAIMKNIIDYRLKNKIVEKGVPEHIATSILQTDPKGNRNANIKWFAILTGVGVGLTIVYYTLPLDIHSFAIMAFCLGASFLGYFLFLKYAEK
jgi:hypothetical protein